MLITRSEAIEVIQHAETGAYYRIIRQVMGLSLREVARRMSLSASFVGDLELGRRHWTQALADTYTDALNLPPIEP